VRRRSPWPTSRGDDLSLLPLEVTPLRRGHRLPGRGAYGIILHTIETEVGEVLHIAGGKIRHSRCTECQGKPRIDDSATSEHRRCGVPPHLILQPTG